jgi:hypothetical protein
MGKGERGHAEIERGRIWNYKSREWEKDAKGKKEREREKRGGRWADWGQGMGQRKEKRREEGIKRRKMQAKRTKKGRKVLEGNVQRKLIVGEVVGEGLGTIE